MKTLLVLSLLISINAVADYKDGNCFNQKKELKFSRTTPQIEKGLSYGVYGAEGKDHFWLLTSPVAKRNVADLLKPNFKQVPLYRYVGVQSHKDNIGTESSLPTFAQCD